jgi:hypothetical protein
MTTEQIKSLLLQYLPRTDGGNAVFRQAVEGLMDRDEEIGLIAAMYKQAHTEINDSHAAEQYHWLYEWSTGNATIAALREEFMKHRRRRFDELRAMTAKVHDQE